MKYKIFFKTGNKTGAGTDADISIKIRGSEKVTNYLTLKSELKQFERGNTDSFYFEAPDIGEVSKLYIKHNNKLLGADWFLENIVLECNKGKWFFSVNKWITGNKVFTLNAKKASNYFLEIITGTIAGSGCKDDVLLSIVGSKGYTDYLNITEYTQEKEFITGHTQIVRLVSEDVGDIEQLNLKLDSGVNSANWFVNKIKIKKSNSEKAVSFPFYNWLESDNVLSSNLDLDEYIIKIYTGDVADAGTDANVYMTVFGSKGNSGKIALNRLISRNAFEAGKVDYVKLACKNLGRIEKINIWHDEKWLADGWYLNKISVKKSKEKHEIVFPYYSWLDKSANPKSTNVVLTTSQPQLRPFYVIAHMVNTPAYVEEALELGSNAIECDITPSLNNDGKFDFNVFHGFRPDFDPDKINLMERSIANTELSLYLNSLKRFEKRYKNFSVIIFDCKITEIPKSKLEQCGRELAARVINELYGKNSRNRVYTIFSIAKKKSEKFIDGVLNVIPKELSRFIGFDLSMEKFYNSEKIFKSKKYANFWWGRGISSSVPIPLQHFLPQILLAAKKRSNSKIIKKIYYWTLDNPDSMARMLVTKLDGMVVNDPLRLLKVLEKEEFRHSYRLANRKDNPFEVI